MRIDFKTVNNLGPQFPWDKRVITFFSVLGFTETITIKHVLHTQR